jgi:hypothetical protein
MFRIDFEVGGCKDEVQCGALFNTTMNSTNFRKGRKFLDYE